MECINSGMLLKVMVEADQLTDIFSSVGEEISFFHGNWSFKGILKKVGSKKRKDDAGEIFFWKELTILIEDIYINKEHYSLQDQNENENHYSFPDQKNFFFNKIEFKV